MPKAPRAKVRKSKDSKLDSLTPRPWPRAVSHGTPVQLAQYSLRTAPDLKCSPKWRQRGGLIEQASWETGMARWPPCGEFEREFPNGAWSSA